MPEIDWAAELKKDEGGSGYDWAAELKKVEEERGPAPEAKDLAPGGLQEPYLRGKMSLLGDTIGEKAMVFKESYPQGDLRRASDGSIIFRRSPDDQYRKVDPSIFSEGGRMADLPSDIADFAGAALPIAGELAVAGTMKNPGLAARTLGAGGGAAAGEGLRQGLQSLLGVQQQTGSEQIGQAATEGVLGAGGQFLIGEPLAFLTNAARGAGGMKGVSKKPGAQGAMKGQRELGLPFLTPGQVSSNPILQRMEGQARALLPAIGEHAEKQVKETGLALRRLGEATGKNYNDQIVKLVDNNLSDAERIYKNQVSNAMERDPETAGNSLVAAIGNYEQKLKHSVDLLYDQARAFGPAEYNLTELQGAAKEILEGVQGQRLITDEMRAAAAESGEKLSETVDLSKLPQEVRDVAQDLLSLDPSLPTVNGATGEQQLMALQQRLFDMKTPGRDGYRERLHGPASRLYNAINDTLKNPQARSPEAQKAWDRASSTAAKRFSVLEESNILNKVKSGDFRAADLSREILNSGSVSDVRFLETQLKRHDPAKWQSFKNFSQAELIRNPGLYERLSKESPEILDAIGNPSQLADIKKFGEMTKAASKLEGKFAADTRTRQTIGRILNSGDPAQAQFLIDTATKGSPDLAQDIKAAMVDTLWDAATSTAKDGTLNFRAFEGAFNQMKDLGMFSQGLFSKAELRALSSLRSYTKFLASAADPGTSLQAASAVASVRSLSMEGFMTMMEAFGTNRIVLHPAGQELLTGSGAIKNPYTFMKAATAALGPLLEQDMQTTLPQGEEK